MKEEIKNLSIEEKILHFSIELDSVKEALGRGALWNSKAEIIPMGRVGTDEEVADLIAFLSSDKARFITGQAININGGSITAR